MIAARAVLALSMLAAVLGAPATARAQSGNSCAISATGVNFGSYNVFSAAPVQSTGGLTFRCGAAVQTVRISLTTGQSGTFSPRTLAGTGDGLAYNLYRNAGRTEIWGDGSGGTFDVPMTPEKNTWIPLTIYAQIPPLQDVRAGAYADTITAIINF
jgi:spore coat protein U-like protein